MNTEAPVGVIRLRRTLNPLGIVAPMQVYIDGEKVGSLMVSQKAEYPVPSGDHAVQLRTFPFSSNVLRVTVSPSGVVALRCSPKLLGGVNLEFEEPAAPSHV